VGPEEDGPAEVGLFEISPAEVGPSEVNLAEVGLAEVGPEEVGPAEVGPLGRIGGEHRLIFNVSDRLNRRHFPIHHSQDAGSAVIHHHNVGLDQLFDQLRGQDIAFYVDAGFVTNFTVAEVHLNVVDRYAVVGAGENRRNGRFD
jgi:hypothetical protein